MSFFGSFGTMPEIDQAIQQGRGAAAAVIGQTYQVRRLTDTTNVSVSMNSPVYNAYPCRLRRTSSKQVLENNTFELLTYIGICDNRSLVLMDQLTETGYEAMQNDTFIFAQGRPTRESIFVRSEATVTITRPTPTSLNSTTQPSSGATYVAGWSGIETQTEQILTLVDGMYAFEDNGTPAQVACGLATNARFTEGKTLDVPVEQYRDQFVCYLPMLPGEEINELDRINFGASDRYEVGKIMTTELTGLAGYVLFMVKLGF